MSDETMPQRLDLLRQLKASAVPSSVEEAHDAKHAVLRAVIAAGIIDGGGDNGDAAPTMQEDADPGIASIVALYRNVSGHERGRGARETWGAEVDAMVAPLRPEDRSKVERHIKHSRWLRRSHAQTEAMVRPALDRDFNVARAEPPKLASFAETLGSRPGLYDYEIAEAGERVLREALAAADMNIVTASLHAVVKHAVPRLRIQFHRLRLIASVVDAAALARQPSIVTECARLIVSTLPTMAIKSGVDASAILQGVFAALAHADDKTLIGELVTALEASAAAAPIVAPASAATGASLLGDGSRARALLASAWSAAQQTKASDREEAMRVIVRSLTHSDAETIASALLSLAPEMQSLSDHVGSVPARRPVKAMLTEEIVDIVLGDGLGVREPWAASFNSSR